MKGVGRQAMEHVVDVRRAGGPFASLADFATRVDPKLVNKRAFESLVRAGAFDALNAQPPRRLVESADAILNHAARNTQEREVGQATLFGEAVAERRRISGSRMSTIGRRMND